MKTAALSLFLVVTVASARAMTIHGTVLDEFGNPPSGTVEIVRQGHFGPSWVVQIGTDGVWSVETTLNDSDVFHLRSVTDDPNLFDEWFENNHDIFLSAAGAGADALSIETTGAGPYSFVLDRGGCISGQAVDEYGDVVPFKVIRLYYQASPTNDSVEVRFVSTDVEGRYAFNQLEDGRYFMYWDNFSESYDRFWYNGVPRNASPRDPVADGATPLDIAGASQLKDIDFLIDYEGLSISGRITSKGGTPLENIRVAALASMNDPNAYETFMDTRADGTYRLVGLDPDATYFIRTFDDDYMDRWYDDIPAREIVSNTAENDGATPITFSGSDMTDIDISLDLGGSICGSIHDVDGNPMVGVQLYLMVPNIEEDESWFLDSTRGEADGSFCFDNLPPGTFFVRTDFRGGVHLDEWYNNASVRFRNAYLDGATPITLEIYENRSNINLIVSTGGCITGKVEDLDGNPITNVDVTVYLESGRQIASRETGADGCYAIDRLGPGDYLVSVNGGDKFHHEVFDDIEVTDPDLFFGYPSGSTVLVINDVEKHQADFRLRRWSGIRGRLTGNSGTPLPFTSVDLVQPEFDERFGEVLHTLVDSVLTDADGFYIFNQLNPGPYYVRSDSENHLNEWFGEAPVTPDFFFGSDPIGDGATRIELPPETILDNMDIDIGPGPSVSGSVRDENGNPLSTFVALFDERGNAWAQGISEPDGTWRFEHLPPGIYYPRVEPAPPRIAEWYGGYAEFNHAAPIYVRVQNITGIDFELGSGAIISGRVKNVEGAPIPDVRMTLRDSNGFFLETVDSRADGTYLLPGLTPGRYFLEAAGPGLRQWYNDVPSTGNPILDKATEIVVEIDSFLTNIDFCVVSSAVTEIRGTIADAGGNPVVFPIIFAINENGNLLFGNSRDDGTYFIREVPPGDWYVLASSSRPGNPGTATWYGGVAEAGLQFIVPDNAMAVQVSGDTPVENIDVQLRPGSLLAGFARDGDGTPLTGALLSLFDGAGNRIDGTTSVNGTWRFESPFPAGDYYLAMTIGNLGVWFGGVPSQPDLDPLAEGATMIEMVAGMDKTDVLMQLVVPSSSISGTLNDPAGEPLPDGRVFLFNEFDEFITSAEVSRQGQFTIPGLRADRYYLSSDASDLFPDTWFGDVPAVQGAVLDGANPIQLGGNDHRTHVDIQMVEGGMISGQVTAPDGRPISDGDVTLHLAEQQFRRVPTTHNGEYLLRGLPFETWYVAADAPGHDAEWFDDVVQTVTTPADDGANATVLSQAGTTAATADFVLDASMVPEVVIQALTATGNQMEIQWQGTAGARYRVERRSDTDLEQWLPAANGEVPEEMNTQTAQADGILRYRFDPGNAILILRVQHAP